MSTGQQTASERAALARILASAAQHCYEAEQPDTETEMDFLIRDLFAADTEHGHCPSCGHDQQRGCDCTCCLAAQVFAYIAASNPEPAF